MPLKITFGSGSSRGYGSGGGSSIDVGLTGSMWNTTSNTTASANNVATLDVAVYNNTGSVYVIWTNISHSSPNFWLTAGYSSTTTYNAIAAGGQGSTFLSKFNNNGQPVWTKRLSSAGQIIQNPFSFNLVIDSKENVYVKYQRSNTSDIISLDNTGIFRWAHIAPLPSATSVDNNHNHGKGKLTIDNYDNLYCGFVDFSNGASSATGIVHRIVKIETSNGYIAWSRTLSETETGGITSSARHPLVVQAYSNNVIALWSSRTVAQTTNILSNTNSLAVNVKGAIFDSTGTFVNGIQYSFANAAESCVTTDWNGSEIVMGGYVHTAGNLPYKSLTFLKYNPSTKAFTSNTVLTMQAIYGTNGAISPGVTQAPYKIVSSNTTHFTLSGMMNSAGDSTTPKAFYAQGTFNLSSIEIIKTRTDYAAATGVARDSNGMFYIGGQDGLRYVDSSNTANAVGFITKTSALSLLCEANSQYNNLKLYPNNFATNNYQITALSQSNSFIAYSNTNFTLLQANGNIPSISNVMTGTSNTTNITGNLTTTSTVTNVNISWPATQYDTIYTTPGTYTWTAPANVTSVAVVAIGGGGGGSSNGYFSAGGGGGLGWKNGITVIPGTGYTVVVGAGGIGYPSGGGNAGNTLFGSNGGNSYFISNTTVMGIGGSGYSGNGTPVIANNSPGGSYVGDGGGDGGWGGYDNIGEAGGGGGGAGGYTGNGGNGGFTRAGVATTAAPTSGTGGAGGGGGVFDDINSISYATGGGGGGVGFYGIGTSGAGGGNTTTTTGGFGGGGGSSASANGANGGINGSSTVTISGARGGFPGGGGSSARTGTTAPTAANGANGAVRVVFLPGAQFGASNGTVNNSIMRTSLPF